MVRTWLVLVMICLVWSGCKTQQNETAPPSAVAAKDEAPKAKPAPASPAPEQPAPKPPQSIPEKGKSDDSDALSTPTVITVKDAGLATPESILHDRDRDIYLVSNINGNPLAADGNGFISQITPEGKVKALKWIDGAADKVTLNAPKGMAISAGTLYVTDLDHVRMFDSDSGGPKEPLKIAGATFLNDLCSAPDGTVYVSDSGYTTGFKPSGTDAVYMIKDGKATAIVRSSALGNPNGLFYRDRKIWVATFGTGDLYSLEVSGKKVAQPKPSYGKLDGLSFTTNGHIVFSSWEAKAVYSGRIGGPFEAIVTGVEAPADIDIDTKRNRVLIPLFTRNELRFHSL